MQMNTVKWLTGLAVIALIACTPATNIDDSYGSGFVEVDEITWSEKNTKPYPFTVASGEISCGSHPKFGRTVYFESKGFTDESYVGTPLNKSAVNSMKLGRLTSNVPHGVKKGADLSEAVQIGLTVCNEQQDRFENS